jgi:hypothetical protein
MYVCLRTFFWRQASTLTFILFQFLSKAGMVLLFFDLIPSRATATARLKSMPEPSATMTMLIASIYTILPAITSAFLVLAILHAASIARNIETKPTATHEIDSNNNNTSIAI